MILTQTRDFIRQHGRVSTSDLALHLQVESSQVPKLVAPWIGKGQVREILGTGHACSGCGGCRQTSNPIYEWVESTAD